MQEIKSPINEQFSSVYPDITSSTKELLEAIANALLERKANDIVLLDVSELTTLTEFFVVCHGNSDTQVKAIADHVMEEVRKKQSEKVWKQEGQQSRQWIILDYVNVVVHVMTQEKREFYGIERMWNDATITYVRD